MKNTFLGIIILTWTFNANGQIQKPTNQPDQIKWILYSTTKGDLPVPNPGKEQTASLILDVNIDGINDFVITERTAAPSITWYHFRNYKWNKFIIEFGPLHIEAGAAHYDIDHDGDEDIVFGGDSQSNEVWWWENPFPDLHPETPWVRRTIKSGGGNKHHDCLFGDFDGDDTEELVFWCQGDKTLYLAEIPDSPKTSEVWNLSPVYTYHDDSQMLQRGQEQYPSWKGIHEHEGLCAIDIDLDGTEDIAGGGRWFKYDGKGSYLENIIDAGYTFSRIAAGQLIEGGRPEVVFVAGDGITPMVLYEYRNGTWFGSILMEGVYNGHSLQILDFNNDGHPDIFSAEMRFDEDKPDARALILTGNGKGEFETTVITSGYGYHESQMADLDGDGDYDLLGKPYLWESPRIDIWINMTR